MTLTEAQRAFNTACRHNDGVEAERLLKSDKDPRALFESARDAHMLSLTGNSCDKVIPVIARWFPQELEVPDQYGVTPFLFAIANGKTQSMLALAAAGANIHAQLPETYRSGLHGAMSLAFFCTNAGRIQLKDHIIAVRSTGVSINAPDKDGLTPLTRTMRSQRLDNIANALKAGANLYTGLRMPPPADPMEPDYDAIATAFNRLRDSDIRDNDYTRAWLINHVEYIIRSAKECGPLTPDHFIRRNVHPNVMGWESMGILSHFFSPAAVGQWKGGIASMIETAHRLPAYIQESINHIGLLRDMPIPREESVTAVYVKGLSSQKETRL